MSEVQQDAPLFQRLRHTPLRDLLRGRVTGRLDVKRLIASADLPEPARSVIERVVRKTRLWKLEKADVAAELIAHFRDGLDAGATVEDLIQSFGDERNAAKLIRRAKVRNRPVAWHVLRGIGWLTAALVAFYLGLGVYFVLGSPSVSVDYVALLNRQTGQTPVEERAWPSYREAIRAMELALEDERDDRGLLLEAMPGSDRWPELASWLQQNGQIVDLIRQGAQRPVLGFELGAKGSINDPDLWPGMADASASRSQDDSPLIAVLLPYLNHMRQMARVLVADARVAAERGDASSWIRDLSAMANMADQLSGADHVLVTQLVGHGIRALQLDEIDRLLARSPERLTDGDLRSLAHRLSRHTTSADFFSFRAERMFIYDVVQRTYTDDGNGDGRMSDEGVRFLMTLTTWTGTPAPEISSLQTGVAMAIGPSALVVSASRAELVGEYDRYVDALEANLLRPLREVDFGPMREQAIRWKRSPIKFAVLSIMAPSLTRVQTSGERYLGQRDGILVAIALELHRRWHGTYPATLAELVPGLLPEIPVDRITGGALTYRLIDGKPVIYSLGADRDDDGGHAPLKAGEPQPLLAAEWNQAPENAPDGDWVLYPQPRQP